MIKWAVELGQFEIEYQPRVAIKAQILADFVVESTGLSNVEEGAVSEVTMVEKTDEQIWLMHVDGSSTREGDGAGIHFQGPNGEDLSYAITLDFVVTKNETEYEAMIAGLEMAIKAKVKSVVVLTNSELVHRQVKGTYEAREFNMIKYLNKTKKLISEFGKFDIQPLPREENLWADLLSKFTGLANGRNERIITWLLSNTSAIELDVTPSIDLLVPKVVR